MKLYWPPARGIMALNSANVSAPPSVKTPASAYASNTIHGDPTLQVMVLALTKTPVPMTLVTMIAVAGTRAKPLSRVALPDAWRAVFSVMVTSLNPMPIHDSIDGVRLVEPSSRAQFEQARELM